MRKLHGAYLEEEEVNLAHLLGLNNLSEFFRDAISYFIAGCDRELTRSEIRELSKKFALEKRAAIERQQKITAKTAEEQAKIAELKESRKKAIFEAVRQEMDRTGMERFERYIKDAHGDYTKIQDDILTSMSKTAGFRVEQADVLAVMGWRL